MNMQLFLFCGGPNYEGEGKPKPLMKMRGGKSLLVHFLDHLKRTRQSLPQSVTLLCDDGQESEFQSDLEGFSFPVPILIKPCGHCASTFEKFSIALRDIGELKTVVQFGYPDIFAFDGFSEPLEEELETSQLLHVSASALTSRFPRLIVDVYNNKIKGLSNYSSPVPANPLLVFGGDLWCRPSQVLPLIEQFKSEITTPSPSLEYDFFFWLVNHEKMNCILQYGERLWVDSLRDINHLLLRMHEIE